MSKKLLNYQDLKKQKEFLKIKNVIIEIKNVRDKFTRRSDATKEKFIEPENISQKIIQNAAHKEKENMKNI